MPCSPRLLVWAVAASICLGRAHALQPLDLEIHPAQPTDRDVVSVRFVWPIACQGIDFAPPQVVGDRINVFGALPTIDCPMVPREETIEVFLGPFVAGDYLLVVDLDHPGSGSPVPVARGEADLRVLPAADQGGVEPLELRVAPALPSAGDPITVHFTVGLGCLEPTFAAATVSGPNVVLVGTYPSGVDCPATIDRQLSPSVGLLLAGDYWLRVEMRREDGLLFAAGAFALHVERKSERLPLRESGETFEVAVSWADARGEAVGSGHPVRLSERSGTFWFFDPSLTEVTVKILDGRALNSHFWVFLANMTDLEVEVTVRWLVDSSCEEQGTCPSRTYRFQPGEIGGVADVEAF